MTTQARVVLIGGGYVSVWAARALRRWARRRVDVTIVTPDPAHTFHGWTGEIVAGDLPAEAGWTPLSEAAPEARVISGRVERVDRSARTVHVRTADGRVSMLGYDHLVVGCGTADRTDSVPGLAERAHTLRGGADVQRLLRDVDQVCGGRQLSGVQSAGPQRWGDSVIVPRMSAPSGGSRRPAGALDTLPSAGVDPVSGAYRPTIVVVGGGLAGVELAGALARRVGPGVVTLVQRSEHLGADLASDHPGLGRRMRADLAAVGVAVRTASPLARVESDRAVLANGDELPADLVVAACGTRVRALPGLEDLPADPTGRLVTDDRLRIADGVWAGGDAACVPFAGGGSCPASALWAITHGTRIGRSIARVTRGRPAGRYRFLGIGRAASLGPGRGYVELRGVAMSGWLAWFVRLAFFLRYAPSGRQALRVAGWWLRVRPRSESAMGVAVQPVGRADEVGAWVGRERVAAAARPRMVGARRPA